jgi:hypothetical protein
MSRPITARLLASTAKTATVTMQDGTSIVAAEPPAVLHTRIVSSASAPVTDGNPVLLGVTKPDGTSIVIDAASVATVG